MKTNRLFALSSLFVAATFGQSAGAFSLFDFTVYTKEGISSQRSDFQGLTGSGGDIILSDFEIRRTRQPMGQYAVFGAGKFELNRGSVHIVRNGRLAQGAVEARDVSIRKAGSVPRRETSDFYVDHRGLAEEMDRASGRLAAGVAMGTPVVVTDNRFVSKGPGSINIFQTSAQDFEARDVFISGSAGDVMVINVQARIDGDWRVVNIRNKGIFIEGGVSQHTILWNFSDSNAVFIGRTGVDRNDSHRKHWGMPGTVLAPHAEVVFTDSLVTGAIFARKLSNIRANPGHEQLPGGQVNDACFNGGATGIGCGATPPPCPPDDKK